MGAKIKADRGTPEGELSQAQPPSKSTITQTSFMTHQRHTIKGTANRVLLALPAALILSAPGALASMASWQETQPAKQAGDAKPQAKEAKKQAADAGQEAAEAKKQKAAEMAAQKQAAVEGGAKSKAEKDALFQEGLKHKAELQRVAQGEGPYGGSTDKDAKLEIPFGQDQFDFGSVMQGAMLEHTFKFKSTGTTDVIIRQAKPTCGCTVGQLLVVNAEGERVPYTIGDPLAPGTEIELTATVDTHNKRNKAQVRINVYANDPVSQHTLTLSADVEPFMTATPSFLNFGELSEDAVKESTIDVRVAKGEPVALSMDTSRQLSQPDGMQVELVAVNPDDAGRSAHWQVNVKVGPGLKEGPLGYAMTLTADKEIDGGKTGPDGTPKHYQINANVNGRVLGVLSCTPQYVSMGLVRPGQVVKRSIQVLSHDPNFEIGNPKVSIRGYKGAEFPWADHFKVLTSPVPGRNGVDIELRLEGLPDGADTSFKGEVVIETGHPQKPSLEVIFSGVCRSGVGRPGQAGEDVGQGVPVKQPVNQVKPAVTPAGGSVGAKETPAKKGEAIGAKPVERPAPKKTGGR